MIRKTNPYTFIEKRIIFRRYIVITKKMQSTESVVTSDREESLHIN